MTKAPLILAAVLYPDFELLDLYGPLEMFGSIGPELEIVTVAASAGPVASAQRPKTLAEASFENCPPLDFILLPGGIAVAEMPAGGRPHRTRCPFRSRRRKAIRSTGSKPHVGSWMAGW